MRSRLERRVEMIWIGAAVAVAALAIGLPVVQFVGMTGRVFGLW